MQAESPSPQASAPTFSPASPTLTMQPSLPTPTAIPLPSLRFDEKSFLQSGSYELQKINTDPKRIRSKNEMPVLIFPLLRSEGQSTLYQRDLQKDIAYFYLPDGFLLGIGDQFSLRGLMNPGQPVVQELQLATIPRLIGGQPYLGLVILSSGLRNLADGSYQNGTDYFESAETDILGDATYYGGKDSIYPNKLINMLIAITYLSDHQLQNGPLQARDGYSYNQLVRLTRGDTYHYEVGNKEMLAAGICGIASLTSTSLYDFSQSLGVDYKDSVSAIIRTQYQHSIADPYTASPFLPVNIDTVVAIGQVYTADFVWQMPPQPDQTFFDFSSAVILNDTPFEKTAADGIGGTADAEFLLTMAMTTQDPGNQVAGLDALIKGYREYRSSQHKTLPPILQQGQKASYFSWSDESFSTLAGWILPLQESSQE